MHLWAPRIFLSVSLCLSLALSLSISFKQVHHTFLLRSPLLLLISPASRGGRSDATNNSHNTILFFDHYRYGNWLASSFSESFENEAGPVERSLGGGKIDNCVPKRQSSNWPHLRLTPQTPNVSRSKFTRSRWNWLEYYAACSRLSLSRLPSRLPKPASQFTLINSIFRHHSNLNILTSHSSRLLFFYSSYYYLIIYFMIFLRIFRNC